MLICRSAALRPQQNRAPSATSLEQKVQRGISDEITAYAALVFAEAAWSANSKTKSKAADKSVHPPPTRLILVDVLLGLQLFDQGLEEDLLILGSARQRDSDFLEGIVI